MSVIKQERCLRVGILGCGPIAQFAHLESVQKARNTVLHAVCDADVVLARTFGEFYGAAKIYNDYEDMLLDPDVEAVVLAVSDAFHVSAATKALLAGKHVLCEKPIGTCVQEVEQLERVVKDSKRVMQVGHMLRFDAGIQATHAFVGREMGGLLAFKAWYCDSTHRYTMTDAIQPMPVSGNGVIKPPGNPKENLEQYFWLAHGSHLVDLARHLCGPIKSVNARMLKRFGAHCWFVETEFVNGALGHLDLTVPVSMDWHEGFQLYGENGSVIANIYNPWYFRTSDVQIFSEADGTFRRPLGADGHFYRRQLESFADVILNDATMQGATIEDGVASVRAMAAVSESVRTGLPVNLADATGAV